MARPLSCSTLLSQSVPWQTCLRLLISQPHQQRLSAIYRIDLGCPWKLEMPFFFTMLIHSS